jgi:uncharacterized membrane protein (DUF2068 family)
METTSVPMSSVPVGAKIISILYYILTAFEILGGLAVLLGHHGLVLRYAGSYTGGVYLIFAILAILLGVLSIFIGIGLWGGQNWARIVAMVFSFLGLLYAISTMIHGRGGYISFVVDLIVILYLAISPRVRASFR